MTGSFLSAWVLFPLVLLGICAGAGLLVRYVSAGAVSGVLLLPVGFALTISICALGTSASWSAPATGALALVVAVVGLALERPRLRISPRISSAVIYPAIAAFVGFAVIAAPVVLTGTTSWTGYERIVDIGFQMAFSQHLAEAGRQVPIIESSFTETIEALTSNGYPGGAQATLGVLARLIRTDLAWCYQAYQAWACAMGALALYALLRRIITNRLICCIGAAVAIQPNVLYAYALVGGIKELTTASLILLVAALLVEQLPGRGPMRSSLALAPAIAAAAAAFSFGIAPWLGLLLLAAFVTSLLSPGRRLHALGSWAIAAGATSILALPSVISSIKLFGTAKQAVTGTVEVGLGNLSAPVPEISSIGVWISNDYRFPGLAHAGVSHDFDVFIVVLGVIGVAYALWRRRWVIAAFGIAAPIALAYWVAHSGPWVEFKAYTITATMFLLMAFVGAGGLATVRGRRLAIPVRVVGWVCVLTVAGAVLYGNAVTYHSISLAPAGRYRQLAAIGERYAGIGPAFYPAFDEYAEFFLRRERAYDLVRPPATRIKLRPNTVHTAPGEPMFSLDLNQLELSFVESNPLVVLPRSPVASRPPANFDLVDRTPEFDVWRRVRPSSEVLFHLPLSGVPATSTRAICGSLAANVRRAGPGARIAYVPSRPLANLIPAAVTHPSYWHGGEAVQAYGAGAIQGSLSLPGSGIYDIWMAGSIGRPLTLYVDGRRIASVGYQERYPDQYIHFADISLSSGRHVIRLTRPNGSLLAGSGDGPDATSGLVGPLLFTLKRAGDEVVRVVPGSEAHRVCAAHAGYQWIEVLRSGAASA
jgi:hypothetical protein